MWPKNCKKCLYWKSHACLFVMGRSCMVLATKLHKCISSVVNVTQNLLEMHVESQMLFCCCWKIWICDQYVFQNVNILKKSHFLWLWGERERENSFIKVQEIPILICGHLIQLHKRSKKKSPLKKSLLIWSEIKLILSNQSLTCQDSFG